MLDQLQVRTTTGTLFPGVFVPCTPSQDHPASTFSYTIGPLAPEEITCIEAPLPDGEVCPLLLPVHLSPSIINHPAFCGGYMYNYLSEEESEEDEAWTMSVPRLVNHLYACLTNTRLYRDLLTDEVTPDVLLWRVGWVLRDLTRLAERDATLAAVGLAHLCFLLPLFTQPRPASWLRYEPYDAYFWHEYAIKAYRARVGLYREQGKSYDEAQRLALVGIVQ